MVKLKAPRRIQEAKMMIWKWIKFKDNSENPSKTKTRQKQARNEVVNAQYATQ